MRILIHVQGNLYSKAGEVLLKKNIDFIIYLFILPVMRGHLSCETTKFDGRFTQVPLYLKFTVFIEQDPARIFIL